MMTVRRDSNKTNWRTWWRIVPAIVSLLLLSACGTAFVCQRLGSLVEWYVADSVLLDDEQTVRLESGLERSRAWYREPRLGRDADFLHGLAIRVERPAAAARQSPGVASTSA